MLVDYDKQSIRKNLDNTYLSEKIERIKKKIESYKNRDTKINVLRERVKAGTYNVSLGDVADSIIDSKKV